MVKDFTDIHPSYTLVSQEYIDEVKSFAALLRHNKTGAMVAVLSNEDKNKVFDIIFRTPPQDSTGVAHILEHSVLCGSRRFPVKDPFVELVKGSLNTFLNAMTYPDKTMYPVASCNDKDFQNLMHVYLDSVFYPNIYQHREIFEQEGWHYALDDVEGELTYNGVVYNEMKGAFSSPEQVLTRKISSLLFPDVTYGQESGGDPDYIPELSYEDFLDFHRRYYHPSNSYIYLYGDFDAAQKLDFIDKEYLSHFDALDVDSEIGLQKPFDEMKEVTEYYSLGSAEEETDNTYLAYSAVLEDSLDPELYIAFGVLDYALMSCPGAPLKKALIESGVAKDVYCEYEKSSRQPYISIVAKNCNPSDKDKFMRVIRETLSGIVNTGLNENSLKAALNTMEFRFREGDYGWIPGGLMYGIMMMDSWLYDKSMPFTHLKCFKTFETLKKNIGSGYFEHLIDRYLLNNPHASLLILAPKKGLAMEKEAQLKSELARYKDSLSREQIDKIAADTAHLKEYQETPSSQEALETIPMLALEDIDKSPIPVRNEEIEIGGFRGLLHDYETKGIGYMKLMFDMTGLPKRLIPYAGLLTNVLGNIDTLSYDYENLNNEINMYTGGIYTTISVYAHSFDKEHRDSNGGDYYPMFEVGGKALYAQLGKMLELMQEIMFASRLDDKKRLKEIIDEIASRLQMAMNSSGHSVAVARATSYFSEDVYYKEMTSGLGFYRFVQNLAKNFEDQAGNLVAALRETLAFIFRKDNIMVDYTSKKEGLDVLGTAISGLEAHLSGHVPQKETLAFSPEKKNEGLITSGMVQYDAVAGNFRNGGFSYHGGLNVLKVILEYDYLWINLRVKGGAYGCMCGFGRSGNAYFTSYRDPHLTETLEIYRQCAEYLRSFDVSGRDMLKYIIGAVSAADAPQMPSMAGVRSLTAWLGNISNEELARTRTQMLETNVDVIRGFADLIQYFVDQNNVCVVGSESQIEDNRGLFTNVENL